MRLTQREIKIIFIVDIIPSCFDDKAHEINDEGSKIAISRTCYPRPVKIYKFSKASHSRHI